MSHASKTSGASSSRISQWKVPHKSLCIRFYLWAKNYSFFYRGSGIYHNGSTKHVSLLSFVMTILLAIVMFFLVIYEYSSYNEVRDIITYKTKDLDLLNDKNRALKPEWTKFNNTEYKSLDCNLFPMYIYVEGLSEDIVTQQNHSIDMNWYIEVTDGNFNKIEDSPTYPNKFDMVANKSEKFKDMHYYLNDTSQD